MNDTKLYHEDIIENTSIRIVFLVLYIILAVVGGIGNGTVIYLLLPGQRSSLDSCTVLLISLAVCDFVTCVVLMPFEIVDILTGFGEHNDPVPLPFCQTCSFISLYIYCVKFHILTMISLERYIIICHPFKAQGWLSFGNVIKALSVVLLLAFVTSLVVPLEFKTTGQVRLKGTNLVFCSLVVGNGGTLTEWLIFYSYLFVMYYVASVCVMILAYSLVFKTLYYEDGIVADPRSQRRYVKKRRRLAQLMLSLAVLFTALHSPYFLLVMSISWGAPPPSQNAIFMMICISYMMGLSSAINPFVYCAQANLFFKKKLASWFHSQSDQCDISRVEGNSMLSTSI